MKNLSPFRPAPHTFKHQLQKIAWLDKKVDQWCFQKLHDEAKSPVLGNVSQVTLQQDLSQSSSNLTMAIENHQDA